MLGSAFGANGTPSAVLVDEQGNVASGLAVGAPQVMALVAPEFPPERQELAAQLARIVLVSPTLFALGTLITSVLNAHQRFLLAQQLAHIDFLDETIEATPETVLRQIWEDQLILAPAAAAPG